MGKLKQDNNIIVDVKRTGLFKKKCSKCGYKVDCPVRVTYDNFPSRARPWYDRFFCTNCYFEVSPK